MGVAVGCCEGGEEGGGLAVGGGVVFGEGPGAGWGCC